MPFQSPEKSIFDIADLEKFKNSKSCEEIISFVKLCCESVIGLKHSDNFPVSEIIIKFQEFMSALMKIVDEIPPLQQPMRYGNKAFRDWHQRMLTECENFVDTLLPRELKAAAVELSTYLGLSFGNETRIDYGTGHELSILVFFQCLLKLGLIRSDDLAATVLRGFNSYIQCMRKLQQAYLLEPAGSHGVWGLDDYHCLTFVFGSAQLIDNPEIEPGSIHNAELLTEKSTEYLYLEGIQFIKKMKSRAPFAETSPMLNDISQMDSWRKVNLGLQRLFQGEVLFKLPVVQHLPFGSLLRCSWIPVHRDQRHVTSGASILTEDQIKTIQQEHATASATVLNDANARSRTHSPSRTGTNSGTRISTVFPQSSPTHSATLSEVYTRAPWAPK